MPIPVPDTIETLICALGLALGLVGFLVGTIFIIRGTCLSSGPRYRGPQESGGRRVGVSEQDGVQDHSLGSNGANGKGE